MTPTRIALLGAAGKMGRAITRVIADTPEVEILAAIERADHPALGMDVGDVAGVGRRLGVALSADLDAAGQAQAVIDFAPGATEACMRIAATHGLGAVIGTTGLGQPGRAAVTAAAAKIPIVLAPNMSVGMNVLFVLLDRAARVLGEGYEVAISETHHKAKRDAPSGTALRLAEVLREAGVKEVPIVSLRGGDVVGDHTVSFLGPGERVEITHRAASRETFARGAVRAARWVAHMAPGLYDMQDVLGLR